MNESAQRKSPRAFALVHFASFLAISTLLAAIAIPAWFSQGDVTLERAATLMARDLRGVQNHAVITGENIHIDFLPESGWTITAGCTFSIRDVTPRPFAAQQLIG